jgi:hypothetical protein
MVKLLRLKDGIDVICDCIFEKDNKIMIDSPMLFELRGMNLVLQQWLPAAVMKGDSVEISSSDVLFTMEPTEDFEEYYINAMVKLKNEDRKANEVELNDEVMAAFEEKEIGKSLLH